MSNLDDARSVSIHVYTYDLRNQPADRKRSQITKQHVGTVLETYLTSTYWCLVGNGWEWGLLG